MFDLTGKTALVTGSSRGIGKVHAGRLAAAGANVVLHGVRFTKSGSHRARSLRAG
jgi:NAD(P)-dependent dehydrogenase (short-subunit alcohol dehydrogenase family)